MSRVHRFSAYGVFANPSAPWVAMWVFIGFGLILPFSQKLNHDVSWLLLATNRLLAGAQIYLDAPDR